MPSMLLVTRYLMVTKLQSHWPGIQTDLTWTPGATFNLTLVNQGSSLDLLINGTEYLTRSIDNTELIWEIWV